MLSEEGKAIMRLTLRVGSRIKSHPFDYDEKAQVLSLKDSIWRWRLIAIVLNLYALFVLGRLFESLLVNNDPLHKCVIQVYFLLANFYFGTLQLNYLMKREAVASFFTQYMSFNRQFNTSNPLESRSDKSGKVLRFLVLAGYSHAFFHGVTFYFLRHNPNFVYSLVVQIWPRLNNIAVQLLFAVFEVMIIFQSWTTAIFSTTTWFTFMENVSIWNSVASETYRDKWTDEWVKHYRSMQLLMGRFNEAYSDVAMTGTMLGVLLECTICTYGTLQFYGRIPILLYACMPIGDLIMLGFVYMLFSFAGRVLSSGEDFVQKELKSLGAGTAQKQQKVLKSKHIRACRSMTVNVGEFFVFQRGTLFTYCQIIVSNTITLLLG